MLAWVLARERLILLGGIAGLVSLAWLYLWQCAGEMDMGMCMDMAMPMPAPWSLAELGAAGVMWSIMMIAMMLPSAAPVLLLFSRAQKSQSQQGWAVVPTGLFAAGYLLVWLAWSWVAALLQWVFQAALLLSPNLEFTSALLGAAFLLLAGLYQLTPWKRTCLTHCQSPLGFLMARWRKGPAGALSMGIYHGAYCAGCCWALMGLLFVGGVMNLLWVVGLAIFVLLEKVVRGMWFSRASGAGLILGGLYLGWTAVSR